MGAIQSWFGADQAGGIFQNSSGFVINGGVFTASRPSAKLTGIANHEQLQSESEVYAQMLFPKKKGYSLWIPNVSDDLLPEYQKQGISIGNVGTIDKEGHFKYFFNILLPSDHPCNMAGGVPAGFVPLSVNLRLKKGTYSPSTHITHPESDICRTQLELCEVQMSSKLEAALANDLKPSMSVADQYHHYVDSERQETETWADPNVPGSGYGTALQAALQTEDLDIMKLLVEKGANP
ncbi:hypothetical protein Moror_11249 [Moniliophthora roreri MCA 2997]|uniref:Uncharacterized protein n=2 Tax=Moniliophthora roreri TaxID=221103 RepID=V2W3X3_MONRO|nr:hypothetical protein Moror_11249 [Moniliophthora roreri MCA 2997]